MRALLPLSLLVVLAVAAAPVRSDIITVDDATYNYWGSIYCDEFLPLITLYDVPDSCFAFLPYLDEPHLAVYDECEYTTVHSATWGAIRAMYR